MTTTQNPNAMTDPADLPVPTLNPEDYFSPRLSVSTLVELANGDSDAASVFALGRDLDTMQGAVVIVRGNTQTQLLRQLLIASGLLTPSKGVSEPAAGRCLKDLAHGEAVPALHCDCGECRAELTTEAAGSPV